MKRVISVLLVALMLIPNIAFSATDTIYAEDDTRRLVEKLRTLGVFEKFDDEVLFGDNSAITRSEAAVALSSMLGVNGAGATATAESKFFDVPPYFEYIYAVNFVTDSGIMSADESGLFRPEEKMKIGHLLKCMVVALGYSWKAEAYGGYPQGYVRVASELKLTATKHIDEIATRVDFLKLIDATLEKPICKTIGFSGENVDFEIDEDVNILSEYHDIYVDEGIVKNNKMMTIMPKTEAYEDSVFIGERRLHLNGVTDINSLVGYEVEYYYRYDSDTQDNYLLIASPTAKNEVTYILKEDFTGYINNVISYSNKAGKGDKLNLSSSVTVLYNGDIVTDVSAAINRYEGVLTAIDNNNDNLADVIIVKNYEYDKVKSIKSDEGKFYCESKIFNLDNYDKVSIMDAATGQEINFSDVKEGQIIGFAEDIAKERLMIEVIGTGSAVKIDSIAEDSFFTENGEEYNIGLLNVKQKSMIKPGATVSIVVADGYYAVWADFASEALNTGYLIKVGEKDRLGKNMLDGVKILGIDGTVKIYEPENEEKIVLNGKKIKTTQLKGTLSAIKATYNLGGDGEVSQLISYKLNDLGKLTHIYTVGSEYDSKLNLKYSYKNYGKVTIYDRNIGASFGLLDSKNYSLNYYISDKNPLFRVPVQGQESAPDEHYTCTVYTEEEFEGSGENDSGWMLDSYIKESRDIVPTAIVAFLENSNNDVTDNDLLSKKGTFVLVDDTYWALDTDGNYKFVLEGLYLNKTVKYFFEDSVGTAAENVKADYNNAEEKAGFTTGDLASIAHNNIGEVIGVVKIFDRETRTLNNDLTNGNWTMEFWSVYNKSNDGTVLEAFEGDLSQGIPGEERMKLYNVSSELREQKSFVFYDDASETVHFGDASDIVDYYQDSSKYTIFIVRHNGGWIWDNQIFYNYNK